MKQTIARRETSLENRRSVFRVDGAGGKERNPGEQTSTTITDHDNETMERQALAQTRTIERGFWNDRKEPDPRRKPAPAPLSIMRSCTRNYAPRFSGIAKNSRPCSDSRRARFLSAAFVRLSFIP